MRERRMECLMEPFRGESFAGYVTFTRNGGATRISCMKLHRVGAISRRVAAGAFVYSIYRNNQSHEQYAEIYRLYETSGARMEI